MSTEHNHCEICERALDDDICPVCVEHSPAGKRRLSEAGARRWVREYLKAAIGSRTGQDIDIGPHGAAELARVLNASQVKP